MGKFSSHIFRLLVMICCFMILIYYVNSVEPTDQKNEEWVPSSSISDGNPISQQGDYSSIFTFPGLLDFDTLATVSVITIEIILAAFVKTGVQLKPGVTSILPDNCLCVLLGVLCGLVLCYACNKDSNGQAFLTSKVSLVLLPLLIVDLTYFLTSLHVFDTVTVVIFSVLGTALSVVCISVLLWIFTKSGICSLNQNTSLSHCLVLGSIISALDPFALVNLVKTIHVESVLHMFLLGESLLGNFLAVIVYHFVKLFCDIGGKNDEGIFNLMISQLFSLMSGISSALLGVTFGFLAAILCSLTTKAQWLRTLVLFGITYLSFCCSRGLHLSGIITLLFCGVSARKFMGLTTKVEDSQNRTTAKVMKVTTYLNETVIYVFLGFYLLIGPITGNAGVVLLTLLLCVLYRTLGVVLQAFLASRLHLLKLTQLNHASLSYSAVRGVCALSLASLLEENVFPDSHFMLTTIVIIVFFSVFIQGTLLQSLFDFLQLYIGKHQNRQLMEQTDNTTMQPIVGPIQNITNCHDEQEFRQKMIKVSNLYLKPVFLHVQTLKSSLRSVIELYTNNSVKEEEAPSIVSESSMAASDDVSTPSTDWSGRVFQKLSVQPKELKSSLSESDLTQNERQGSIPMPDATSNTCLDLAALEVLETRKMKDDSKIHHLMEGITFKHSIRVLKFKRHSEPEPDMDEDHHHARYHLRKLVNPIYHDHQHGHHSYSLGIHRHSRKDIYDIFNDTEISPERPRKNVSFADQSEIAEALGLFADRSRAWRTADNDDGDVGITFTASSETPPLVEERNQVRTAVESLLPWKRNTGREPVSSSLTHSLPEDDKPPVSEVPSWVKNEDDSDIPGVCLEDIMSDHLSQEELNIGNSALPESGSESKCSSGCSRHTSSGEDPTHNSGNSRIPPGSDVINAERVHETSSVNHGEESMRQTDSDGNEDVVVSYMHRNSVAQSSDVEFSWMGSPSSCTHDFTSNPEPPQVDENVLPAPWKTDDDQDVVISPCSNHMMAPVCEVDGEAQPTAVELPPPWRESETPQSLPSPTMPVSSHQSFPWIENMDGNHDHEGVTLPPPWLTSSSSEPNNEHETQEEQVREFELTQNDFSTHSFQALHRSKSQPGSEFRCKQENRAEVTNNDTSLCRSNSCPMETGVLPPPPWRCNNSDYYESSVSLPPPWRCSSSDLCQEEVKSAILPPPWKNNGDDHADPDLGAIPPPPWRSNGDPADLPVRSPSASQDVDYCSIRPQASQQSYKLSEAESKHSEQISIPQIMEMPPRFYVEVDLSDGDSDEEDSYLAAEMDFTERLERWLETIDPSIGPFDDEWEEYNRHIDSTTS